MEQINEPTLLHIVIRHCSHVEIPSQIQRFPKLLGLKIYNSTIIRWDSDAALTANSHPNIVFLYIVEVYLNELPDGLLSINFPQSLLDIEFSGTNLSCIPDDLDQKWPNEGLVVFEKSFLNHIPEVLVRMNLPYLALGDNRIANVPAQIFTNPSAVLILLDQNPIESLPSELIPSGILVFLSLGSTNIETFPDWFDDNFFEHVSVVASDSNACIELIASIAIENNLDTPEKRANRSFQLDCKRKRDYLYYPYHIEVSLDEQYQ